MSVEGGLAVASKWAVIRLRGNGRHLDGAKQGHQGELNTTRSIVKPRRFNLDLNRSAYNG